MKLFKKSIAEFFGTFCLVLLACGVAAVTSTNNSNFTDSATHLIATALTFGLVLTAMCYSVGSISGCHINPAVSLGFLLKNLFQPKEKRNFGWKEFFVYIVAQFIGSFVACLVLWGILGSTSGFGADAIQPYLLSTSHIMAKYQTLVAAFVEIILTAIFVFVVLAVTSKKKFSRISGVVIGVALTLVHLVGIPLTGTSVNPARGLFPSLFAYFLPTWFGVTSPISLLNELWIWTICPFVGAAIAALIYYVIFMWREKDEDKEEPEYVCYQTINNNYTTVAAPVVSKKTVEKEEVIAPVEEPLVEETKKEESVQEKEIEVETETPTEESTEEPVEEPTETKPKEARVVVPFKTRLKEADPELRNKFNELKDYCLSYDLHERTSIDCDTFRLHKIRYVVIAIRGKSLKLHIAVNAADYIDSPITVLNDVNKNKYKDIPGVFKVKSDLSVKRAKILIDDAMTKAGIIKKTN